jgi:hypothetical protein
VDDVEQVIAELGGASMNIDSWFGQAVTWSEAHGRAVQEPGRAIAVDGRVQWFEPGEIRLMIRSWTLLMEDGPRMQLELLPQYSKPHVQDFDRILGRETRPDALFSSIALDLRMEVGHAYVLMWEQPQVEWRAVEDSPSASRAMKSPSTDDGSEAAAATPAPNGSRRDAGPPPARLGKGPVADSGGGDGLGPDAALPQTLGEMLLGGAGHPPTRGVIAFIPRIPADVFPPSREAAAAAPQSREGSR